MLQDLYYRGDEVAPMSAGADFKGRTSKELLAYRSVWDMEQPVIVNPARKLGYRFMTAEAAWTLGGDNRLNTIKPYGRAIANFSDDGRTLSGAYGPPFIEQAGWVAQTLLKDSASRQAVATIWRPRPAQSRDTPCTVALQWLIRPDGSLHGSGLPLLHCVATMRSSDAWTGVPYDVFNFSMMSAYILIALKQLRGHHKIVPEDIRLGNLYLTAGSQHLYKQDWDDALPCLKEPTPRMVDPIEVDQFETTDVLIDHLWTIANKDHKAFYTGSGSTFLHEMMPEPETEKPA